MAPLLRILPLFQRGHTDGQGRHSSHKAVNPLGQNIGVGDHNFHLAPLLLRGLWASQIRLHPNPHAIDIKAGVMALWPGQHKGPDRLGIERNVVPVGGWEPACPGGVPALSRLAQDVLGIGAPQPY